MRAAVVVVVLLAAALAAVAAAQEARFLAQVRHKHTGKHRAAQRKDPAGGPHHDRGKHASAWDTPAPVTELFRGPPTAGVVEVPAGSPPTHRNCVVASTGALVSGFLLTAGGTHYCCTAEGVLNGKSCEVTYDGTCAAYVLRKSPADYVTAKDGTACFTSCYGLAAAAGAAPVDVAEADKFTGTLIHTQNFPFTSASATEEVLLDGAGMSRNMYRTAYRVHANTANVQLLEEAARHTLDDETLSKRKEQLSEVACAFKGELVAVPTGAGAASQHAMPQRVGLTQRTCKVEMCAGRTRFFSFGLYYDDASGQCFGACFTKTATRKAAPSSGAAIVI